MLAIFGATIYRFYALNWWGVILTVLLSVGGLIYFWKLLKKELAKNEIGMNTGRSIYPDGCRGRYDTEKTDTGSHGYSLKNWKNYHWAILYFLFFLASFFFLYQGRSSEALTSPWQSVPKLFFLSYGLATLALFWLIKKGVKNSLLFICAHYFLSFSILWMVFRLGFGYDPFIHQASLELIDQQGFIKPKEIFYSGYYSLIIITHKLFLIPIIWLNKLLVPVLAALILPKIISDFSKSHFQISNFKFQILLLLTLPFSLFTVSVPQNLAYLFLITAIFVGLIKKDRSHLALVWLLALACFAIHPLAGLPALAFALALSLWHLVPKIWQQVGHGAIFLGLAVILPLALSISQSGQSGAEAPIINSTSNWLAGFSRQENLILNFINLFSYSLNFILIFLAVAAIVFSWLKRQKYEFLPILSGLSLSLFAAFLATKQFVSFGALISYERGDYLIRLLTTAFIFLLPAIVLLTVELINKILSQNKFIKTTWLIFCVLLITTSVYCSYPRKDNYFNSRSFSVGQTDFKAIDWIEKDAAGQPYAVLANQQVSVAALSTFGFGHYFQNYNDFPLPVYIYFYPIPTGGPLYQIYLDMVYKQADRATVKKASELTTAKTIYFVLNKYWWGFDKIAEEAKIGADSLKELDSGKVVIFKYSF